MAPGAQYQPMKNLVKITKQAERLAAINIQRGKLIELADRLAEGSNNVTLSIFAPKDKRVTMGSGGMLMHESRPSAYEGILSQMFSYRSGPEAQEDRYPINDVTGLQIVAVLLTALDKERLELVKSLTKMGIK